MPLRAPLTGCPEVDRQGFLRLSLGKHSKETCPAGFLQRFEGVGSKVIRSHSLRQFFQKAPGNRGFSLSPQLRAHRTVRSACAPDVCTRAWMRPGALTHENRLSACYGTTGNWSMT